MNFGCQQFLNDKNFAKKTRWYWSIENYKNVYDWKNELDYFKLFHAIVIMFAITVIFLGRKTHFYYLDKKNGRKNNDWI